jgi:signal transduction histidine kinase/ligand-binding sensor domain-containing protein/CheY-like chemotaxis protein/AraC-like DNA-binding protein
MPIYDASVGIRRRSMITADRGAPRRPLTTVIVLATMLTCLAKGDASAQRVHILGPTRTSAMVHETWTQADGLPVNAINDIIQDRSGYLWVATYDGLVRFDGMRFTVYNAVNSPGLRTNRILGITEARDGVLWLLSEERHLVRFQDSRFTTIRGGRPDDGDAGVNAMLEDSSGTVWVGTTTGIGVVRGERIEPVGSSMGDVNVTAFVQRRDGAIWAASAGAGLYRVAGPGRVEKIPVDASLEQDDISAMYEDGSGQLWVGGTRGLWTVSAQSGTATVLAGPTQQVIGFYTLAGTGEVRVLTTQGIYRLDSTRAVAVRIFTTPSRASSGWTDGEAVWHVDGNVVYRDGEAVFTLPGVMASHASPMAALRDSEGNVWLGTQSGGLRRLKSALFTTFSVEEGIAARNVSPVFVDRAGRTWLATRGAGLSRIDLVRGRVTTWTPDHGLSHEVFSFHGDANGRLWLGTLDGPYSCEPSALVCRAEGPPAICNTHVLAMHGEGSTRIWFGTDRGVWYVDGTTWAQVPTRDAPSVAVRAFAVTTDGALWMGTNGQGVARFHQGRSTRVTAAQGLPSDHVRALYADADGWLWIGTEGLGLARLDARAFTGTSGATSVRQGDASRTDKRVVRIGTEHGLYDQVIHQILEDDFGRLWMSTNRGIFWVTRAELNDFAEGRIARVHSTSYTERDGMRNREANGGVQPAGAKGPDGRLWFPTQDGVVMVDPARVGRDPVRPSVIVERVSAAGTVLELVAGGVRVMPDKRDLEIEYTAPTFREPANVRFRYRLDPYDRVWVDAGNRRTAFYTRVPPGRYTFHIEASTGSGEWGEGAVAIPISVEPYFHETPLAKALLFLAMAGLVIAAFRWRLGAARRRERDLTALVEARTAALHEHERQLAGQNEQLGAQAAKLAALNQLRSQLFANLSHEFRTPLTLILGPLRSLLDGRHGQLSGDVREQAALMHRNGQRLQRLIDQILDLTRLQAGAVTLNRRVHDAVAFTRSVTQAFTPLAERRGIALHFSGPLTPITAVFDAEQMEKPLLNLLSNSLKFTERGGEVVVSIRALPHDRVAEIAVRDTGVGIAPEQLPRVFERFYQSDSSASRRYEGTGIGLALARELVELHGGSIRAESEVGRGSTFTIVIPLGTTAGEAPIVVGPSLAAEMRADAAGLDLTTPTPGTPTDPAALGAETALDRTTVLVIDDNADVRTYVGSVLGATYRVIEAADGAAGLETAHVELPDLIVADVMMPGLDGLGLARALKDNAMTDAIPVVLLTARAATEDQVAGFETGADAYLVKPFEPAVLEACIASLLAQRRRLRERFRGGAPLPAPAPAIVAISALELKLRPLVEARLTDPEMGPEQLAAAAGLSYHQLYRALREELETTPSRFIRGVRVECARALLERGAGSVTEVAYSVGFESLSYFSRAYRERFGTAPSAHSRSAAPTGGD